MNIEMIYLFFIESKIYEKLVTLIAQSFLINNTLLCIFRHTLKAVNCSADSVFQKRKETELQ